MTDTFTYLTSSSVSVAAADQQTKEWLYSNKVILAYFLQYSTVIIIITIIVALD